jgi:hypothetical protein
VIGLGLATAVLFGYSTTGTIRPILAINHHCYIVEISGPVRQTVIDPKPQQKDKLSPLNGGELFARQLIQPHRDSACGSRSDVPKCFDRTPGQRNLARSYGSHSVFHPLVKFDVKSWGQPVVLKFNRERGVSREAIGLIIYFGKHQVWPELKLDCPLLSFQRAFSGFGTIFGVYSGLLGVECGHPGSRKRQSGDQASNDSEIPGSIRSATGGISGIPLGAKIGATALLAFAAFGVMLAGFGRVLNRGGDAIKGLLLLCAGGVLWVASAFPWWISGS